jgi:Lrp/AsnC family transcriptional regulator
MSETTSLDAIDKRILRIVQNDASLTIYEIATQVGLSQTPCWKRLQRLRASGVIKRRVELLDPVKLGLGTTVFVSIQVGDYSGKGLAHFAANVAAMEEVMDFYRVAGNVDYVLRVVVPDTAAFDRFYKRLIALVQLKDVTSCFTLENIKSETAFPITG